MGNGAEPTPTKENSKTLAAVAYILTWLTGLIIFLVADKDDRYARWHALQAIGLGIAAFLVGIVLNILAGIAGLTAGGFGGGWYFWGGGLLGSIWSLLVIVLIIVLAVKAYQGENIRLPIIADIADDNA